MSARIMATTKLIPPPSTTVSFSNLPADAQERVRRYQAAGQAKNTSIAYATQLRLFRRWCERQGYTDTPPVAPAIVATWLLERADTGAARSTLAVALAAIKFGHRIAGQRFDGADPELVRALAGARRETLREQRQAAPLRPAVLGDVLASL